MNDAERWAQQLRGYLTTNPEAVPAAFVAGLVSAVIDRPGGPGNPDPHICPMCCGAGTVPT